MSVRTTEEILTSLKEILAGDTSDKAIEILEDVTDTFSELAKPKDDGEDWKAKYEENDKAWREKYRDRFFNSPADPEESEPEQMPDEPAEEKTKFEELFVEKEG